MSANRLQNIRHISFDAWNTLIEPNLEFSHFRSELIAETYNIPYEKAKAAYTATKRFLDTAAELTGFGTNTPNVYRLLNAQLRNTLTDDELVELNQKVNVLFAEHPPTMPDELGDELVKLRGLGYTLNILSNTNYISGTELIKVFDRILGKNFFHFALFSDHWNMAKPHANFYLNMFTSAQEARNESLDPLQIVHIGDNKITDFEGALSNGFMAWLIKNPADLAIQLEVATRA